MDISNNQVFRKKKMTDNVIKFPGKSESETEFKYDTIDNFPIVMSSLVLSECIRHGFITEGDYDFEAMEPHLFMISEAIRSLIFSVNGEYHPLQDIAVDVFHGVE